MRGPRLVLTLLLSGTLGSCGLVGDDYDEVLFITQWGRPGVVMEALYQGKVDVRGTCVRLTGLPEGHSVVWPYGFHLGGPGNQLVYNEGNKIVGRLGDVFRLAGGEVETLWEGGPVSEELRQRALDECPGRFWLVGEVGPQ